MITRNQQFGNDLTSFQRLSTRSASQFLCSKPILKMEEERIPPNQQASPYLDDIFEYLYANQHKISQIKYSIFNRLDCGCSLKFKFQPETLYWLINLIDRYLSKNTFIRNRLKLLGIASLFIASKFEEIYAPELKDFVHDCDNAFTKEEILKMESKILLTDYFI